MLVVMNRMNVPVQHEEQIKKAFVHSTKSMNQVEGFIDFQLMHSKENNEFLVYTKWQSEDDYQAWKTSEAFNQSHAGTENLDVNANIEMLDVVVL